MTIRSTFEGRCGNCSHVLGYPSLDDVSYGEAILSTEDGAGFVHVSGFSDFSQRVHELIKGTDVSLWNSLALLADPVPGKR